MKYTKLFRELNRNDAAIAGGKGASLGEMLNAGIPVPDGYVVLSTTFDKFIEDTDLVQEVDAILDGVNHKEIHTVESASEKIKGLILSREMPHDIAEEIKTNFKSLGTKFVAVRSSATAEDGAEHAWAGQLESYLNTTDKDLLDKVKHCWASLFTPRAIFYRFEKGLHSTRISVAVVVQKMVESEVSGIAFSVHPVTEDRNQSIIEAGFGLGEAIVSGSVTPDSYVVEKIPRRVIDKNISTQERGLFRVETGGNEWRTIDEPKASSQVLGEKQIFDLSEIIVGIENHYGFPCDIEWAYEKGKFYIVQSRPITTLSAPKQSNLPFDERIQKMFEEKRPLHCNVHYPKIPVINVEASLEALIKNKYYSSLGKEADLAGIMYMDQEFSYWNHIPSIPPISEIKFIEKIIVDTKKKIPEYKKDLQAVYSTSDEEMSKPEKVIESLKEVNRISKELYVLFGLFIDEAFHVSEESVMQQLQEIRMQMDDVGVNYLYKAYDKVFKTLTDTFKIDKDIVINSTTDDIIKMVRGTLNNPENLRERAIAYVLYRNKISVHYGEEAKAIYQYLLNQDPDKTLLEDAKKSNEIRGLVGHKGKAKGKVVKLSATDYRNKQKLDQLLSNGSFVLVAPMTVPELVPYFKDAVAFVTDEGGITCHAAIIARELNKPCVTGTRVATQTLKDGDMVEVDADKGVVRIIN